MFPITSSFFLSTQRGKAPQLGQPTQGIYGEGYTVGLVGRPLGDVSQVVARVCERVS